MCMYLHCGSSYHLYLHVRQWSACHERSRSNQIPFWYGLETASGMFGIGPMIIGSIYVTAGAMIVGVPIGLLTAVFLAKYCPKKIYKIVKPMINLMAGIPSIIYGFFGLVVIIPVIQDIFGTSGKGILAASILLGMMILPTIINTAESSIRAVPDSYYEGALALGATKERSISARSFLRQNPALCPELFWVWEEPSERPWRWSWLPEIRRLFRMEF